MSWCRKPLLLLPLTVLALGLTAAKNEDTAKKEGKVETKKAEKDEGKKDKKERKEGGEGAGEKGAQKMTIPVPPGHDAKGLVIPMRDPAGNLQMRFTMEIGKRTDGDHLEMSKLLIETFDSEGNGEMTIDLPQSILDLNTRIISTENGVVIKRSDFELSGKTMEFDTSTKQGRLGGKVRMLIYNLENETNSTPRESAGAPPVAPKAPDAR